MTQVKNRNWIFLQVVFSDIHAYGTMMKAFVFTVAYF